MEQLLHVGPSGVAPLSPLWLLLTGLRDDNNLYGRQAGLGFRSSVLACFPDWNAIGELRGRLIVLNSHDSWPRLSLRAFATQNLIKYPRAEIRVLSFICIRAFLGCRQRFLAQTLKLHGLKCWSIWVSKFIIACRVCFFYGRRCRV